MTAMSLRQLLICARKTFSPWFTLGLGVIAFGFASAPGWAGQHRAGVSSSGVDAQFQGILEKISRAQVDAALDAVNQLTDRHPNFLLGHLVRGDLLLARSKPILGFGNTGHDARDRLEGLRAETFARLLANGDQPPAGFIPRALLRFSPGQSHAVVVDASRSRVYVYQNENGIPRLVEDYYASIGKRGIEKVVEGDQKTPIGFYNVTSTIPGSKLPDLYGWGAFPINYPNEWDRLQRKTGYGIWLHGVPSDTYARPPLASDGCIALANPDMESLAKRIQPGTTPVIISERIEWVRPDAWRAEGDDFIRQLETWRQDWESLDNDRYLAHYARSFRSGAMDLDAWTAHKRRVTAQKTWIKVSLENVSVFRSAAAGKPIVVTFDQSYRSNALTQKTRKRQYWVMEERRWKIAYEASLRITASALPESFPAARK